MEWDSNPPEVRRGRKRRIVSHRGAHTSRAGQGPSLAGQESQRLHDEEFPQASTSPAAVARERIIVTEASTQEETSACDASSLKRESSKSTTPIFALDSALGKTHRYAELLQRESIEFFSHLNPVFSNLDSQEDVIVEGDAYGRFTRQLVPSLGSRRKGRPFFNDGKGAEEKINGKRDVQTDASNSSCSLSIDELIGEALEKEESIEWDEKDEGLRKESTWSRSELQGFFRGLARYSRWRPDLIATDYLNNLKSEAEVCELLALFRRRSVEDTEALYPVRADGRHMLRMMRLGKISRGNVRRKRKRSVTADAAVEMSNEWIAFEEAQARLLAHWHDDPRQQTDRDEGVIVPWDRQVINAALYLRNSYDVCGGAPLASLENGLQHCNLEVTQGSASAILCSLSDLLSRLERIRGRNLRQPSFKRFSEEYAVPAIRKTNSMKPPTFKIIHRAVELGLLAWVHVQEDVRSRPTVKLAATEDRKVGVLANRGELATHSHTHLIWIDSVELSASFQDPRLSLTQIEQAKFTLQQGRLDLARKHCQSLTHSELSSLEQGMVIEGHPRQTQISSISVDTPRVSDLDCIYRGFDLSDIPREQWKGVKGKIRARLSRGSANLPIDACIKGGRKKKTLTISGENGAIREKVANGPVDSRIWKRNRINNETSLTASSQSSPVSTKERQALDERDQRCLRRSSTQIKFDSFDSAEAKRDFQRFHWIGVEPKEVISMIFETDDDREKEGRNDEESFLMNSSIVKFSGLATLLRNSPLLRLKATEARYAFDLGGGRRERDRTKPSQIDKKTILTLTDDLRDFVENVVLVLIVRYGKEVPLDISEEMIREALSRVLRGRTGICVESDAAPFAESTHQALVVEEQRHPSRSENPDQAEESDFSTEEQERRESEVFDEQTRILNGLKPLPQSQTTKEDPVSRAFEWSCGEADLDPPESIHSVSATTAAGKVRARVKGKAVTSRETMRDKVDNKKFAYRDRMAERSLWSLFGLLPTTADSFAT